MGVPNPDKLAREIPSLLLAEWMAYSMIEPFGPVAEWTQAGIVASMIQNVNRSKETSPIAQPSDFLPKEMTVVHVDAEASAERNGELLRALPELIRGK